MRKIALSLLILALAILTACGPSRDKSAKTITSLENRLYAMSASGFDKVKADSLLADYESFIRHFPDDTLTMKYTFKAANLCMNMGDGTKSIDLFDKYIKNYPDSPKAAVSMFFKGYIYENQVKNLDKAKEIYLQFIEKYPNNEFAKDARIALQNLGKSPEEIIKEFEERQKEDSIRKADSIAALKPVKHQKKRS